MGDVQAGELGLAGAVAGQVEMVQEPVVQRSVGIELQGADGVGNPLHRVALAVGPVVGGIDAPPVAGAVVGVMADAVQHRIAHEHVLVGHVDAGPQHSLAVGELAGGHPPEQVQVLLGAAVAPRAVGACLGEAAPVLGDGLGVLVVDVGQAGHNQVFGPLVELIEVVRRVQGAPVGFVAQPGDVLLDGSHEVGPLRLGVGVVEAQVAGAAELGGQVEVQADRLGVADVEIAVGLGGESGLHPAIEGAIGDVLADQAADEVAALAGLIASRIPGIAHIHHP